MNIIPPGPQEAFVPIGASGSNEAGWPLSAESEERINPNTEAYHNYRILDEALTRLDNEFPLLYSAIMQAYLHPEAGHSDVDVWWRRNALISSDPRWNDLVKRHDVAITQLAKYLLDSKLYVEFPRKATGPKPGTDMAERHKELFATYERYRDQGLNYRQAVNAAGRACDYSPRHADRKIKEMLAEVGG